MFDATNPIKHGVACNFLFIDPHFRPVCYFVLHVSCPIPFFPFIFLNKTGNFASFYSKKLKRIDRFIYKGNRPKTHTNAPWNTTILGTPPQPTWLPTRNTNIQGDRDEIAAERLHRHTSPRRRFRRHPQLPKRVCQPQFPFIGVQR